MSLHHRIKVMSKKYCNYAHNCHINLYKMLFFFKYQKYYFTSQYDSLGGSLMVLKIKI